MRLNGMVFLLAWVAVPAFAETACENPRDDFDGVYCLSKIYLQADAELNALYGKLRAQLDAEGVAKLKRGQLAWIDSRNARCGRHNEEGFFVNLGCAASTTIKRAQFLQDRLRECVASGCQNSKL